MQTDGIEKEVLQELASRLLMKKDELVEFLKDKVDKPSVVVEIVTKRLQSQGFITYVTPIGQSCVAITQKGIRAIERE